MEIRPSEIEHVEDIGSLDSNPVKIVKCVGGLWIVVGKPKGKKQEEALAAGSHPAIVKYNVEKQFPDFQPSLAKSELAGFSDNIVGFSELLPQDMRKSGHEMYSISKGNEIKYILTRHGCEINSLSAQLSEESLKLNKSDSSIPSGFSRAISTASSRQAKAAGKKYIECENSKFCVNRLLKG